jgi:uncharacterized protein YjiS (DUF1127 family)
MTAKAVTRKVCTAATFVSIGRAVAALAMEVWRRVLAIRHHRDHRRDLAHLADLDDRMLADIGLMRTDLRDANAELLWQDPTGMLAHRAGRRP